jgi:hypothetical protein
MKLNIPIMFGYFDDFFELYCVYTYLLFEPLKKSEPDRQLFQP